MNASIQYFSSIPVLLNKLKSILIPTGEIHILDSPFYYQNQVSAAADRSIEYYEKLEIPDMAQYYHHHGIEEVKQFEVLYRPKSKWQKLWNKRDSPFPWLRFVKNPASSC